MLKKETIQKTVEMLQKDGLELRKKIKNEFDTFQNLGNFRVTGIHNWDRDEEDYEINFKHKVVDFDFEIKSKSFVNRLGWSSHSYSHFKDEADFNKSVDSSIEYISVVQEMLQHFKNKKETQKILDSIVSVYIKDILPLEKSAREISKEIDQCNKTIKAIKTAEILDEAEKLLIDGSEFYTSNLYHYTQRKSTNYFKIIKKGKNLWAYTNPNIDYAYKFKITAPEDKISLYKFITKINYDSNYDYETKECTYYKYNNLLSKEEYENRELIKQNEITKEEYKENRY